MSQVEPRVTRGNVLSIVATFVSLAATIVLVAIAWGVQSAAIESATKGLEDHESRIRALEVQVLSTLTRMDARLSAIEGAVTR